MRDSHLLSQAQAVPVALPVQRAALAYSSTESATIPWSMWFVLGTTLTVVAGAWDLAWHMSIGRDAFWTPPHILMYMSAVLVGIGCTGAIISTTFSGASAARDASVRILGLHAPAGVFIAAWGSAAMLASAPFDNWWHNAYGLDASIVTPPHVLGALGSLAAKAGAMAWIASMVNRFRNALHGRLIGWFLLMGSIVMSEVSVMIYRPTWLSNMHTARCYLAIAVFIPPIMIATGWGSTRKWGCTIIGATYTGLLLAAEWLLPLIPAQPRLGPVFHNVTHLVPLRFPLLLIVPAIVTDLLLQKLNQRSSWIKAACVGPAFVLSFLAVQWPFASFLMTPASRNWIFGTAYFAYIDPAGILYDPYKFNVLEATAGAFILTMMAALVTSILTTRLGLAWGSWMRRVCR